MEIYFHPRMWHVSGEMAAGVVQALHHLSRRDGTMIDGHKVSIV